MISIYHLHFTDEKPGLEKSHNLLPNHSGIMGQRRDSKLDLFALWFFSSILTLGGGGVREEVRERGIKKRLG